MEKLYEISREENETIGPNIKVIGVGGGGNNMINYVADKGIKGVELIAANTDKQALETCKAEKKIQLGKKVTKGLGAGMRPDLGAKAAEESYEEIKEALAGADLVFISAGMGGGTGTGASPLVAKAAKEVGALAIGVVTKPFLFEGAKRMRLALQGIENLREAADSIVVIPNDKILQIIDRKVGMREAFSLVDDVLYRAVSGISNMVITYGSNDINVDFNDLKTVMSYKGLALMGVGEAKGENSATTAIETAINSPLMDNISIDGAMGVLVHFTIHSDYSLASISESMELIYNRVDPEADIIFGTTTDNELDVDEVKITIVATGFDEAKNEAVLKKNSIPRRPVKEERKKSSTTSKSSPFTARNATTSSHKTTQTPKSTPQPEPKLQPQPEEPKKEEQKIDLVELFRQELKNIDLDDDFDTPTVFRH